MIDKKLITKKESLIVYFVFGIPMIVLIAFVVYNATTGPSLLEMEKADNLAQNITGRVDSLYFDERNHNGKYAVLHNKQIFPVYRSWERYIELGDSLSKKKGSFFLEIYKKNNMRMTLDYRDTYR